MSESQGISRKIAPVGAPGEGAGAVYAWSGPAAVAGTEADWISSVDVDSLGFGNTLSARFDDNGGTLVVGVPELGAVGIYALPLPPGQMDFS